jgi:hypothetical protein
VRDQDGNEVCEHHGSAVGEAQMPSFKRGDCHDFALKKAQSQALKRAAINLGDQFGLSLYRKGLTEALIGKVVGFDAAGQEATVEMHEPDVVEDYDPDVADEVDEPEIEVPSVHPHDPRFDPAVDDAEPEQLPLDDAEPPPDPDTTILATPKQVTKIMTLFGVMGGYKEREKKLAYMTKIVGRPIESSKKMTMDEAALVIDQMEKETGPR